MGDALFRLPDHPFFSCEEEGFAVVDGARMRDAAAIGSIAPVLRLDVGPGNVFEQRPRSVIRRVGDVVSVACDAGVTVHLDFGELAARVEGPAGEFVYLGGLDEGNDGRGFLRAR